MAEQCVVHYDDISFNESNIKPLDSPGLLSLQIAKSARIKLGGLNFSKVQMITLFYTIKISSLTRDLSTAVLLSSSVMIGILTVGSNFPGVGDVTFDCFFRIVRSSNAFEFRRNEVVDGR